MTKTWYLINPEGEIFINKKLVNKIKMFRSNSTNIIK